MKYYYNHKKQDTISRLELWIQESATAGFVSLLYTMFTFPPETQRYVEIMTGVFFAVSAGMIFYTIIQERKRNNSCNLFVLLKGIVLFCVFIIMICFKGIVE